MPEGIKISISVVWSTLLKILGVICGIAVFVTALVAIVGSPRTLFAFPVWRYYTPTNTQVIYADNSVFAPAIVYPRPHEKVTFIWNTRYNRRVVECNSGRGILPDGFGSNINISQGTSGKYTIKVSTLKQGTHYFCLTGADTPNTCTTVTGRIQPSRESHFRTPAKFGNQNIRYVYAVWAICLLAFGVIIILGELRLDMVVSKFTFFYYSFFKGVLYITLGVAIMAVSNALGLVTAIILWITGLLNCYNGRNSFLHYRWNEVGQRGTTTIVTRREYI